MSSVDMIKRLMNVMPGAPRIYFGVVDVRDVADLQLRAMTHPAAKSERFIAVSGNAHIDATSPGFCGPGPRRIMQLHTPRAARLPESFEWVPRGYR